MTNLREQFRRVQKVFKNFCASYKTISIRPNRSLETNFSKKCYLLGDKTFWPILSRIIDCEKPRGTIDKSAQGVVTITVEVTKSFP